MLKVHFTRFSERTKEGGIFSYQTDEKDNVRERERERGGAMKR
jgi:hypothetical protein